MQPDVNFTGMPEAIFLNRLTHCNRISPPGIGRFGQTCDLVGLYCEYRLDVHAILDAAAEFVL